MARRYVMMYEIDEKAVEARRTLDDWRTFLADGDESVASEINSWEDVMEAMIMEFVASGDFTEFVTELDSGFAEEVSF